MKKITIASTREGAGKTSIIVGLANALGKNYGYIKPFGDRLIYRRKKNWDYDANLLVNILGLDEEPENVCIGFNHSKLKYILDEKRTRETVLEMANNIGKDKEILFIEGGKDLSYGSSINLDSISISGYTKSTLIIVLNGDGDRIMDDLKFLDKYTDIPDQDFAGIIINNVPDAEDFENTYSRTITEMGFNILGIIPFQEQLSCFTLNYLAEKLFAKTIAGESGIRNTVKNIFVGAMSTGESLRNPLFQKENKLLITSGDRSDMILAAIDTGSAGIILTNNVMPPSNIIARANEKKIPLLLVSTDTLQEAKQIDRMEALLTNENSERIELLTELMKKHVKLDEIA